MKTITTKLAAVRPYAEGWTDHALRSLIHGCGDSPRRARKALASGDMIGIGEGEALPVAQFLAAQFDAAIAAGTPYVHAIQAANERWHALYPLQTTEAAEVVDEADEAEEPAPAPTKARKGALSAMAAQLATA